MNIRVTNKESEFCKQVAATLFLRGQLQKPTVSALVREALRVYLNSVWIERDVFVAKQFIADPLANTASIVDDWPMRHDIPIEGQP